MASCHTQAPFKRNQRGYGKMPYPPKEAICVGMAGCHTLL